MTNRRWMLAFAAAAWVAQAAPLRAAEAWRPAAAPLMTRWAKDVSPERARPEYPRPNAVRREWRSLNGIWEFAFDDANAGRAAGFPSGHSLPERILVPWTFEAALSGIGKGKEIHERVWYRCQFDVPGGWRGRRILLHFGAVDWEATVWVNGREVGTHRGGYAPFTFDVTDALKAGRYQELVVGVYDPADPKKGAFQPKGKQLGSEGIWYTRTTGIWQTVWLEPVAPTHIEDFRLDGDAGGILVTSAMIRTGNPGGISLDVRVTRNGRPAAPAARISVSEMGAGQESRPKISTKVEQPELWSPESPSLYDVTLTLRQNGRVVDEVRSYCGFRTIGWKSGRITLNGKPYFLRGVLDQGFWPDGIYTPPTDEAIRSEVETTKAFGFNTARKHVKVEDPRWYYHCDRLGLIVAQDMPSSHNLTPPGAKANFVHEWTEVMATTRKHPSVLLWVTFNEDWGHPVEFQDAVVELTRKTDPTRPIIDASGWTQRDKTDMTDIHDYSNNLRRHAGNHARATWVGEYGGVALPVEGHTWVKGWGYQTVKTPNELLDKYRFLTSQLNNAPGLSGFVYTQLTDVEQELNGLMTYDRIPKAPPERFADVVKQARPVTEPAGVRGTIRLVIDPVGVRLAAPASQQ